MNLNNFKIDTCTWNYDSWVGLVYSKIQKTALLFISLCVIATVFHCSTTAPSTTETGTIYITSTPPKADIFLDGELIGQTSTTEIELPVGEYDLLLVQGNIQKTVRVKIVRGSNPPMHVIM